MKSLTEFALNIPEDAYHKLPAWSYSKIARYAKNGFSEIAQLDAPVTPTPAMKFGTLVDNILTRGSKASKDYIIFDKEIPAAEKGVLDCLMKISSCKKFDDVSMSVFLEAVQIAEYQKNWRPETQYNHVYAYSDYYNASKSGKIIISRKDWEDACSMAKAIHENEYLKDIFTTTSTSDIEYIYQAQFCVDWELPSGRRVQLKIMPDLMVVNHKEKTIHPVDLKTSANPSWQFWENFIRMRYDLQARLYSDVLNKMVNSIPEYKGYTLLPYLFADISRTDMIPTSYDWDPYSDTQKDGLSYTSSGRTYKYKNWEELLDEIIDYKDRNAIVPKYISVTVPNDLESLINNHQNGL